MRRVGLALLLLLGLAAPCGAQSGNPEHDRLAAMTTRQQNEALAGLLRGSHKICTTLLAVYFAGLDAMRTAFWDTRCDNGFSWRIAIPRDETAGSIAVCSALSATCFLPARRVLGDNAPLRRAQCSAACELQIGEVRQACVTRCLRGTEAVAGVGEPGADRHVALVVGEMATLTNGFLGSGTSSYSAAGAARELCVAMPGVHDCRISALAVNQCLALAQSSEGEVFVGRGAESGDAESDARHVCGSETNCQIIISGC
jgi:hypothetical protein